MTAFVLGYRYGVALEFHQDSLLIAPKGSEPFGNHNEDNLGQGQVSQRVRCRVFLGLGFGPASRDKCSCELGESCPLRCRSQEGRFVKDVTFVVQKVGYAAG